MYYISGGDLKFREVKTVPICMYTFNLLRIKTFKEREKPNTEWNYRFGCYVNVISES